MDRLLHDDLASRGNARLAMTLPSPRSMRRLLLCCFCFFLLVDDEVEPIQCTDTCDMTHKDIDNVPVPCGQLVVYEPPKILPQFQEPEKQFEFAGREWVILQRWNDLGVPAVVWEAVSDPMNMNIRA